LTGQFYASQFSNKCSYKTTYPGVTSKEMDAKKEYSVTTENRPARAKNKRI